MIIMMMMIGGRFSVVHRLNENVFVGGGSPLKQFLDFVFLFLSDNIINKRKTTKKKKVKSSKEGVKKNLINLSL